jgi:predicted nucleic acid-binding protein
MDTNVLYAGLRSNRGASFQLLQMLRASQWTLLLSNTVATEYEEILLREASVLGISLDETSDLLDDFCALAELCNVSGSWEPLLSDPDDEAFAQLAFETTADCLITHNSFHFEPAKARGIRIVTPKEFLAMVRAGL